MTRTDSTAVGLYDRPFMATNANADVFISIHNNAVGDGVNPFVAAGTSGGTAALAVNAIRRWRQGGGSPRYPGATRLLLACDAGGASDWRSHLRKDQPALLAGETGPRVTPGAWGGRGGPPHVWSLWCAGKCGTMEYAQLRAYPGLHHCVSDA